MKYRFAYLLAIWFSCGRFPKMPGTAGTVGAVRLYLLLAQGGPLTVLGGALIVTVVGVWAATEVVRKTGLKDPQIVCIDEAAGVLLTLAAAPPPGKASLRVWCSFACSTSSSLGQPGRRSAGEKAGAW